MSEFVNKILAELKTNAALRSEPLVKMIAESTEKSISLGENREKIYAELKNGLLSINEKVKNPALGVIISQFSKNETTPDSKVHKIATEANLAKHIASIKSSTAYSNPVVKTQVELFESYLNSGSPDFVLCESFIKSFNLHTYDTAVKKAVDKVSAYLTENASKVRMLNTIYQMETTNTQIYAPINSDLKKMLISESYSADILKIKFGNTMPIINALVNDLMVIESNQFGTFTIGLGNGETRVNNLITPAIKTHDGLLMYTDNRFLSIREAKGLTGNETKIHLNESFKISDFSPEYVKNTYSKFYEFCEAYSTLGFKVSEDRLGVESNLARGIKMNFKLNESKNLELYINGEKFESSNSLYESLALESTQTKARVKSILENAENLFHLEFIKEITNDRTLSEALVLNLNEAYYICDKVNAADRVWSRVNEHQLNQFFTSKFNYDVTSIFKVKIDESINAIKKIEERKHSILVDIEKLEKTALKIDETIVNGQLDNEDATKLTEIKESITATISNLKKEYARVDLLKKKIV
jgi:hypothetical protein